MSTDLEGNSPIYITRKRDRNHEDIYINNAKVIREKSNVICYNDDGKKQVCLKLFLIIITLLVTSPN